MAVVLKATQEVPAVSALGSYSLLGTLAKSEILDTQGNVTSLGEVQPSESELAIGVSQNLFRDWCFGLLARATENIEVLEVAGRAG